MFERKIQNYFDYAVNYNRWSMRVFGLWPTEDCPLANCLFFLAIIILIQSALPVYVYLSTTKDILEDLDALILFLTMLTCIARLIILKLHKKNLKIIIDTMYHDWKNYPNLFPRVQKIFISNAYCGRKVNLFFFVILFFAAFVYVISPMYVQWKQMTLSDNMKILVFKSKFSFDFQTSPNYEVLYLFQTVVSLYLCLTIFATDSFLVIIVFHLISQLEIIVNNIRHWDCKNVNCHLKVLEFGECNCFKCIIEHHVQLRRNLKIIQDSFNIIMFLQFTSNAFILCVQGYIIVKATYAGNLFGLLSYLSYIFFSTFNVFMYCNLGEHIIEKSTSIAREVSEIPWYNMNPKCRRLLIIIIRRSNKPFELKAGHYFIMSLATYKSIIITAFSYTSCLLAMSEK